MQPTTTQATEEYRAKVLAAINVIRAVASTIQELGSVPSGHLYAACMAKMTLEQYQAIIDALKAAQLVSETNNLLTWIGPKMENSNA